MDCVSDVRFTQLSVLSAVLGLILVPLRSI